jgi:hypothetical protein
LIKELKLIRRLEVEQTDLSLSKLIRENPIKRNEELISFLQILDSIKGGLSIFLDGKWGSGKTVFVKQAVLALQCLHGTYKKSI